MQKKRGFIGLATRALAQSLTVKLMITLARELIPGYNLHKRTGIPESIAIPNINAARQIVVDMKRQDIFPQFINLLIEAQYKGIKGRTYPIAHLRELINGIQGQGYLYDYENKMFVEDPRVRRTKNWGVLRNGVEYSFAFLGIDIVDSSSLVRKYKKEIVNGTYSDLYLIVKSCCEKRNGRFWNWEGDGGLVAFFFASKNTLAVLSGMEIIHEIFLYNKLKCRLPVPLKIRLTIHSGKCAYTGNEEELKNLDIIKEIIKIESKYSRQNSVTVSQTVLPSLDQRITDILRQEKKNAKILYYYSLKKK
jgi:hypothetical protein